MLIRTLITCLALLLCGSLAAQKTTAERAGQRAKDRAERRAEGRLDQKVDRAVDDAFNAVGNLFKKKKKNKKQPAETTGGNKPTKPGNGGVDGDAEAERAEGLLGQIMGGGKKWEPYTNPRTFSVTMTTTETRRNGKQQQTVSTIAVNETNFGIRITADEPGSNRMILDTQTGKTTMVNVDKNGETTATRMRIPSFTGGETVAFDPEEMNDRFSSKRTGQRRTIDGYDCELWVTTDTKTGNVTESWVTQDVDLTMIEVLGGMANAFGGQAPKQAQDVRGVFTGFPVLSIMEDNGKTYETRFSDVRLGAGNYDRSVLDVSGLTVQELGF